jgi:hypothetical protein
MAATVKVGHEMMNVQTSSRIPSFQPLQDHSQDVTIRHTPGLESRSVYKHDAVKGTAFEESYFCSRNLSCATIQVVSNAVGSARGRFNELKRIGS